MRARVATVVLCGALGLAACGDDEDESSAASSTSTNTATTANAEDEAGGIPEISGSKPEPSIQEGTSLRSALPKQADGLPLEEVEALPALTDAGALDAIAALYADLDAFEGVHHELGLFPSPEDADAWRQEVIDYVTREGAPGGSYVVAGEEPVVRDDGTEAGTVTMLTRPPGLLTVLWTNGAVYGAIDANVSSSADLVIGVYEDLPY